MYCNITNCIINQYTLNTGVAVWRWRPAVEKFSSDIWYIC